MHNILALSPAQIWIGQHEIVHQHLIAELQKQFCTHKECGHCTVCKAIANYQHHALMLIQPEKSYTLEMLDPIFSAFSFGLDDGQHFFCIIDKAEWLSPACSNKLLKSIEEPPRGYHIIFITQRIDALLPTLRSRCIERNFYTATHTIHNQELYNHFIGMHPHDPVNFLQTLESSKISEQESIELLDAIIGFWAAKYTAAAPHNNPLAPAIEATLEKLKNYLDKTPMPGSAKLFWKDLYLTLSKQLAA